jgi:hypothetical protein
MMPFFNNNFYYITGALQLICVIHCIRKGNQQKWIWIIVFVPLVGGIAYIVTEMFTGREIQQVQSGIGSLINPSGSIRKLEENLRFSDTFNNRIALADAYLATGQTDKAVEFYERDNHTQEANSIFKSIIDESAHLNSRERSSNRIWLTKAKEELKQVR